MTVTQLLESILLFDEKDQHRIIDYYTVIDGLYKRHGNSLTNPTILKTISQESSELSELIQSVDTTIGFDQIKTLIQRYHSHTPEQVTSTVNPNNKLGINIQSTHGK
ncbi:hypothetical protein KBB05_02620 [Patescibacteria group bacterium]|nr:hypothetical protein [Patescibacteria group bacterium]